MPVPEKLQLNREPAKKEYIAIPPTPESFGTATDAISKIFKVQEKLDKIPPEEINMIAEHPEMIFAQYQEFRNNPAFYDKYLELRARVAAHQLEAGFKWVTNHFNIIEAQAKILEEKIPKGDPRRIKIINQILTLTNQGLKSLIAMNEEWEKMKTPDRDVQILGRIQHLIDETKKLITQKELNSEFYNHEIALQKIADLSYENIYNTEWGNFSSEIGVKLNEARQYPVQIEKVKKYNELFAEMQKVQDNRRLRKQNI